MVEMVGAHLKDLRLSKGWTVGQAAAYSGVSGATISRVETGRRNPEPETLQKLARAYNADEAELMTMAGHLRTTVEISDEHTPAPKALDAILASLGIPAPKREWWVSGIMREADPLAGDEVRLVTV